MTWFDAFGRDLPWRRTRDPYAILVSEVMLQQTQVERVLRRTKASFSSAAAQALMDLGATICVARIPRCAECPLAPVCPSRGIREEPTRKQGSFEGSFRQRRADTLRLVAESSRRLDALDAEAVGSLERDGLVVVAEGAVALPEFIPA